MTTRHETFESVKSLLARLEEGPACNSPECPNVGRLHIVVESITINTLIVAGGELPQEIRERLARAHA